jgi:hypothetical protein
VLPPLTGALLPLKAVHPSAASPNSPEDRDVLGAAHPQLASGQLGHPAAAPLSNLSFMGPRPELAQLRRERSELEVLIRDGWAARSPQLSIDIVQCTLDNYFGILSRLPQDGSGRKMQKFLAGLCLVCKAWLAPARRVLYHEGIHTSDRFIRTIQTSAAVRPFVHRVIRSAESFVDATWLSLLPNCTAELVVRLRDDGDLQDIWPNVVAHDLKQLKKLVIDADNADSDEFEGLVQTFSHLEILELEEYDFWVSAFPFAPKFPDVYFASLTVLKLEHCQHMWFPSTSPSTLQKLELNRCLDIDAASFIVFIRNHTDSLLDISISTQFRRAGGMDVFLELVKAGKKVQNLDLDLYEWRTSPAFLEQVSLDLVKLALHGDENRIFASDIVNFLERRRALDTGKLRSLEILLVEKQDDEGVDRWEEVKKTAESMGVEFSLAWLVK